MFRTPLAACFALPVTIFANSACAMNAPRAQDVRCVVERAERLPADVGGAAGICALIERAAAGAGPVNVTVTVVSANELSAAITNRHGHMLPELRFAKSDRPLSRASVGRFARSIAQAARD